MILTLEKKLRKKASNKHPLTCEKITQNWYIRRILKPTRRKLTLLRQNKASYLIKSN